MIEASHKYDSLFKAAANRSGIAFAAALALALGIGVNAAIFDLGGLRHTADLFPDPTAFFLESSSLPQMADAVISTDADCGHDHGGLEGTDEYALPCAFFYTRGGDSAFESRAYALLLGDYLITTNLYAERTSVSHSRGSSACE